MKTLRAILVVLVFAAAVFETSCGGSGSGITQPPPPTLSSISVTSASSSVTVGQTIQLTATGTYSDGSAQNLTNSATWSSSSASVATISAFGRRHGSCGRDGNVHRNLRINNGNESNGNGQIRHPPSLR